MKGICVNINSGLVDKTVNKIVDEVNNNKELSDYMLKNNLYIDRGRVKSLLQLSLSSEKNKNDDLPESEIIEMTVEHYKRVILGTEEKSDSVVAGLSLLPKVAQHVVINELNKLGTSKQLVVSQIRRPYGIFEKEGVYILDNNFSISDFDQLLYKKPYLKRLFEERGNKGFVGITKSFIDNNHFKIFMGLMAVEFTKGSVNFNRFFDSSNNGMYFKKNDAANHVMNIYNKSLELYNSNSSLSFLRDSGSSAIREYSGKGNNILRTIGLKWKSLVSVSSTSNGSFYLNASGNSTNAVDARLLFEKMYGFMGYNLVLNNNHNTGEVLLRPFGNNTVLTTRDKLLGLSGILNAHNANSSDSTMFGKSEQELTDIIKSALFAYNNITGKELLNKENAVYNFSRSLVDFFAREYGIKLHSLSTAIKNNRVADALHAVDLTHAELSELNNYSFEREEFNFADVGTDNNDLKGYAQLDTAFEVKQTIGKDAMTGLTVKDYVEFAVKRYEEKGNVLMPKMIQSIIENNQFLNNVVVKVDNLKDNSIFGKSVIDKTVANSVMVLSDSIPNAPLLNISVEDVFFHELVHLATMYNMSSELKQQTSAFISEIKKGITRNLLKKGHSENEVNSILSSSEYMGLNSPSEFFAELFRSPSLAKAVDELDATGMVEVKQNFFSKLIDLLAKVFGFKKSNTALGEAKQLLSDALTLNQSGILTANDKLLRSKEKLRKAEITSKVYGINRFMTNGYTGDYLLELTDWLLNEYKDRPKIHNKIVNAVAEHEVKHPLKYGSLRMFIGKMAIDDNQLHSNTPDVLSVNFDGLLSPEFKVNFKNRLKDEKFLHKFLDFKSFHTISNLKNKEKAVYIVDGVLLNLPIVYGKDTTYVLYTDSNSDSMLIPLGIYNSENKDNIPVELREGVIWHNRYVGNEGKVLLSKFPDYYAPAIERVFTTTKQERLMVAYNNDLSLIKDRQNAILSFINHIIDNWQEENPELSRDEVINNHSYGDLYKELINMLEFYLWDDGGINEKYWQIFNNLDALIDNIVEDLRASQGIVLNATSFSRIATDESYISNRVIGTLEGMERNNYLLGNEEGKKDKSDKKKNQLKREDSNLTEELDETISDEDLRVDDEIEEDEDNEEKDVERYLLKADSQNIFDRTSRLVRQKMYDLGYYFTQPNRLDDMGVVRKVPFETSKNAVIEALQGIRNSNEIIERLQKYSDKYPFLKGLSTMLKRDPRFLTEFFNTFNLWTVDAARINFRHHVPFYNLNIQEGRDDVLNSWIGNVENGNVINKEWSIYDSGITVNLKKVKNRVSTLREYIAEYKDIVGSLSKNNDSLNDKNNDKEKVFTMAKNIFEAIGAQIEYYDVQRILEKAYNNAVSGYPAKMVKLVNIIDSRLAWLQENDFRVLNMVKTNVDLSEVCAPPLTGIFKEHAKYLSALKEQIVKYEGETRYLNRQASYLSTIFKGIKNQDGSLEKLHNFFDEKFNYPGLYSLQNPYTQLNNTNKEVHIKYYSNLLNELYSLEDYREELSYTTAFNIDGTKWKDMTRVELLEGRYRAFYSGYSEIEQAVKDRYAYYQIPTLSDSPELGYIKMKRYELIDKNKKPIIATYLCNLARAELNRINFVNRRAKMKGIAKIKHFDSFGNKEGNGAKFVTFPFLEEHKTKLLDLLNNTLSPEFSKEEIDSTTLEIERIMIEAIETYLDNLSKEFYNEMRGKYPDNYVNHTYENMRRYVYNDYLATAEILTLLGIDPAFYKNAQDFQKRFKQVYSSGVPLDTNAEIYSFDYDKDGNNMTRKSERELVGKNERRVLVLRDFEVFSAVSEQLIQALERGFPDSNQRISIAKKLGAYNSEVDGKKFYVTSNNSGEQVSEQIDPINITDGQTLISLEEMRAVNVMSGKWSDEAERSYIKYTQSDKKNRDKHLSEWMNTVKSFYYSDTRIETGDDIVPFIKNNVQFKHAEKAQFDYELVRRSKLLNAITEFLNDVDTVDAISFESTQKVGVTATNVVDINGVADDPAAVKKMLYDAVRDKKYVSVGYENLVIQQPTKNKISNNKNANIGSQPRRIIIGNIKNNTRFNVQGLDLSKSEFINTYNNIINEQIRRSFEILKKTFSDNDSLSRLLKRAVLNNKRYHRDLLNAFDLDQYGNFKLPLFNPQNSVLVQEMLMSIIKKSITKRKMRGGKAVNVSNIGYHDDLVMQFDADGNLGYFETYMPWYGTKEEYDAIHDEDGNLDMSKIDEKLLTALSYRVPTEDLYSIVPLKIKGFLPPGQGTNIILPSEILALTGLDFDIDTLGMLFYDYKAIRDDEGTIIRLEVTDSIFNKVTGKKSKMIGGKSVVSKETVALAKTILAENPDMLNNVYSEMGITDAASATPKNYNDAVLKYAGNIVKNKEFKDVGDEKKFTTDDINNVIRHATKEELDNSFLDMALSRVLHPDSTAHRLNPGGFDSLREVSVNVQLARLGVTYNDVKDKNYEDKLRLIESKVYDLNSPLTHAYFTIQNTVASGNIGIFANAKSFHNLSTAVEHFKLVPKKEAVGLNLKHAAKLLGVTDFSLSNMSFTDANGAEVQVSKELATDVAAAVDAVKDPVHSGIGVNKENINLYIGLKTLGVDINKIGYLLNIESLNSDALKNLKFDTYKYNSSLADEFDTIIDKLDLQSFSEMVSTDSEQAFKIRFGESKGKRFDKYFRTLMAVVSEFGNTVKEVTLSTRYDSQNSAPKKSFSKMQSLLRKNRILFEHGTDMFSVDVSEDYDNMFSKVMFDYSYTKPMELLNNVMNIHAQRYIYDLLPEMDDAKSEQIIRNSYTDYILDSISNELGIKSDNFITVFPSYFLDAVRNSKHVESELFKRIGYARDKDGKPTKELGIITTSRNEKDVYIQDWLNLYKDPAYKQLALQLAVYSIRTQSFEYGSKKFSYMIPSEIMAEISNFDALRIEPSLLNDYIFKNVVKNLNSIVLKNVSKFMSMSKSSAGHTTEQVIEHLQQKLDNGLYTSVGRTFSRFYKVNNDVIFIDFDNKVHKLTEYMKQLGDKNNNDVTDGDGVLIEPSAEVVKNPLNIDRFEEYLSGNDDLFSDEVDMDYLLEDLIYDTESFKNMKQIYNLRDTISDIEHELSVLYSTIDQKYKHLSDIVENSSDNKGEYLELFQLPQFAGMERDEIQRILNDMRNCGASI